MEAPTRSELLGRPEVDHEALEADGWLVVLLVVPVDIVIEILSAKVLVSDSHPHVILSAFDFGRSSGSSLPGYESLLHTWTCPLLNTTRQVPRVSRGKLRLPPLTGGSELQALTCTSG